MSANTTKRKRATAAQVPVLTPQTSVLYSLLDCYDFLASNEYSEKTIGIQAFVTRKSICDINFSDIIDDSEKRNRQGQATNFSGLLEDKRSNLPLIDASVEKCLMLTRLISYIKENESRFTSIISDIRLEMQYKMADNQNAQNPCDFRKREREFNDRKYAQEIRRLFYHSHDEVKQPQNLIYVTTEQLTHIVTQMSRDSKSRQAYINELEATFRTSFLIVAQPHSGVNPVTIYERKGPGEYTAKISVTIISLLHDFIQTHPNLIELFDIEPSLSPSSPYYKLEEPRSLSWKTCQLQTAPGGKSRTFLYAELSAITIEQSSKTDTRVRFAQLLHSFKFAIKLQLNLADNKMSPIYHILLESLQFGIGAHNNQIPQLLTRVILDDIQRFSKIRPADVRTVLNYMQRYFIHRTGVRPNGCVSINLEQELIKATNQRSDSQSIEDIYLDFLVNFVHQVEFMAKHPLLAMFHADGLFLGICNSERAAEAIVQSSMSGSPIISLRFNSIRIDYTTISASSTGNRSIKFPACAIRVDIYNDRTKKLQNRTFDSATLVTDISKFVSSAHTENANRIHVLSDFDDRTNEKAYLSFGEFSKYHHKRLQEILKNDEKYKPVTDLIDNANDGNTDEDGSDNNSQISNDFFPFSPNSLASLLPMTSNAFDNEQSSDEISVHDYTSIAYESQNNSIASPQNILSPSGPSQQQSQQTTYVNNQDAILKYILSQPNVAEEVIRRYGVYNAASPVGPSQQLLQQPHPQYQTQPLSYQPPSPIIVSQQRTSPQVSFQQPQHQPLYYQQQPQIYQKQEPQMQFQQGNLQQQPQIYQKQEPQMQFQQGNLQQYPQAQFQDVPRRTSPSVIHYLPINNTTPPPSSLPQPAQQLQFSTTNSNENIPQVVLNRIRDWNLSNGNINQPTANSIQQQTPSNEVEN
ncbi:unnamed protein product [Rotaria sp. Silwood2]|nr:unnamed protein product [Rotaria sp. Silwood2]CAF2775717.1 unnamed protein product [Rotaria sp. Silwood2]CAF3959983.1 unnamed protein product [Rotaria sp. Silwood2]CAF4272264.1 unnamed protein product [Rotaria sp. Silwood2]